MHVRPAASHPAGYVVALIGIVAFVVSCFLPFYGASFIGPEETASLFRLVSIPTAGAQRVGGVLYLFAGAATVGVISVIGLVRAPAWTPQALVAGVAVWALTWFGVLLNQSQFGSFEVGYWTAYASLAVAVAGAIVVWATSRHREREPAPAGSE